MGEHRWLKSSSLSFSENGTSSGGMVMWKCSKCHAQQFTGVSSGEPKKEGCTK